MSVREVLVERKAVHGRYWRRFKVASGTWACTGIADSAESWWEAAWAGCTCHKISVSIWISMRAPTKKPAAITLSWSVIPKRMFYREISRESCA